MADYVVTSPDGSKFRITAPTDEAAHEAARRLFAPGGPAGNSAQPTPLPQGSDTVVDIPGVGHVSFPPSMSRADIEDAIKTKILPRYGQQSAPLATTPGSRGSGAAAATEPDVPPQQRSFSERMGRQLDLGTRAVGRGVADVVGLPVDLLTAAINTASSGINLAGRQFDRDPGIKPILRPVGGSDSIKDAASALFGEGPTPENRPEGLTGHVIEGATSFLLPAAAYSKAASAALDAGKAADSLPPLLRPYGQAQEAAAKMEPGVKKTWTAVRPVVVDTAAGAGSGAGQDIAPDTPLGKLLGSLGGGIGGATAVNLATAPYAAAKAIAGHMAPNAVTGTTQHVANVAGKMAQEAVLSPTEAKTTLLRKDQQYRDAGISPPSTWLMAEDPGAVALEKGLRSRGEFSNDFVRGDQRTRASMSEAVDDLKPNADPRIATDFADVSGAIKHGQAQTAVDKATGKVDQATRADQALRDTIAPNLSLEAPASVAIDKTIRGTLGEQRGIKNQLYRDAQEAGADVRRDIGPLQAAADAVRAEASKLAPESKILPQDFLAKIDAATTRSAPQRTETGVLGSDGRPLVRETPGEQPSYADIAGLRPPLKAAITQAQAEGNGAMVDALVRLKSEVEGEGQRVATDAAKPGANPELTALADNIRAANSNYRNVYAPNFVKGEGGAFRQDLARDATGANTQPSQTAKRFLTTQESAEDLARIVELAGSPAEAKKAARDYLFAQIAKNTLDGNRVNELRLNKWVAQNKGILEQFPEANSEIRYLQRRVQNNTAVGTSAYNELAKAKEKLGMTDREIERSGLGFMMGRDPMNAVEAAFASGDPERAVAQITATLGGKGSKAPLMQSWKRAVADWVESKVTNQNPAATDTGENPVSLAKLGKLDERHEKALSAVFTPTEMNSLQAVQKAAEDMSRLGSVRATVGSNTSEDMQRMLNLTELLAKAHFGQLKGGGVTRTLRLLLNNLGMLNDGAKAAAVLARASRDPELAAHLLEMPTGRTDRSLWNSRLNKLMGVAAAGRSPEAPQ